MTVPQLPTTLPTLEEAFRGRTGDARTLLEAIQEALEIADYHCYCVHTEVEGMRFPNFLRSLLEMVLSRGVSVGTLGAIAATQRDLPHCHIEQRLLPGRFDSVSYQGNV